MAFSSKYKQNACPKEYAREYAESIQGRYGRLGISAKQRGLITEISLNEYKALIRRNQCDYCLGPLNRTGSGLDRIDSSLGYIQGNVIPCCRKCNMAKANLSQNEFLELISAIYHCKIANK